LFTTMLSEASRYADAALASPTEMLAVVAVMVASGFVLVSTFVKTMIPLRWLAVGSNIGFVAYGAIHPSYPMMLLHAALLPINLYRLAEMMRLTRRVRKVSNDGHTSAVWLKPYMRARKYKAGAVLFRQGDHGDRFYLLAEGRIDLVEIQSTIEPGSMFGEIAFFAPDRRRRLTARCAVDCTVLSIDETTVRQLFYQNPAFGFKLIELVAGRLSADVRRVTDQLIDERHKSAAATAEAHIDTKADVID
jgi:CRP/FNR family cyclic AMP-dependent transcriptional regulator